MKKETKIALIAFPIGFGLFWLLRKHVLERKKPAAAPPARTPSDEDLETAFFAYDDALQHGEDASTLYSLNDSFATNWGMQVQKRDADGVLVATDMKGNVIATYDPLGQSAAANNAQ